MDFSIEKKSIIKKRIDYFSKAAVIMVALSAIPDVYYGIWKNVALVVVVILVFIVCIYFNKHQAGTLWGSIVSLSANFLVFYASASFGDISRAYFFYLPLFIATFLITDYKNKWEVFFNIAHIIIGIFVLDVLDVSFLKDQSIDQQAVVWFGRFNTLLALVASIYFLVAFINEIAQNEQALVNAQEQLKKQNAILSQKNEELDRLIYSISHDIKSPLSSMEGLVGLAKLENKQDSLTPYLSRIEGSIFKLKKFVLDIIDYFKNTKFELQPTEIDFEQEINAVLQSVENLPNFNQINIQVTVKQKVKFLCDKMRLQTILLNLISNAIKYQKPEEKNKKVEITVMVWDFKARIEVFDNGIGVDHPIQNKVFDMFYRGTVQSEGSGLGLYIMNETVKRMHGFVKLESVPDLYSRFIVEIPATILEKA